VETVLGVNSNLVVKFWEYCKECPAALPFDLRVLKRPTTVLSVIIFTPWIRDEFLSGFQIQDPSAFLARFSGSLFCYEYWETVRNKRKDPDPGYKNPRIRDPG
jgi:hypothetical protein